MQIELTIQSSLGSRDHLTLSNQKLYTQVNGKAVSVTAKVSRSGQTVLITLANGSIIKPMVRVHSTMQMAMSTPAPGQTIKQTEKVSTLTIMELAMKVIGERTCSMGLVLKLGQTILNILVTTNSVQNTDSEFTNGLINLNI